MPWPTISLSLSRGVISARHPAVALFKSSVNASGAGCLDVGVVAYLSELPHEDNAMKPDWSSVALLVGQVLLEL